jgi:pimeloyl-ACP methyl ester carboxylesterase
MPTITTNDGAQLFYEDVGEGPPLILVPGWGCTHRFFQKNTAALARSYRVIAPDMRAHGGSKKVAWGHRIARYAKDVKVRANGHGTLPPSLRRAGRRTPRPSRGPARVTNLWCTDVRGPIRPSERK